MSDVVSVAGTIKTGPPEQASGGDFTVLVRRSEFDAAQVKDEAELIVAYASGASFASTAGATFYRFLVIEGVVFQIIKIEEQPGAIRVAVRPYDDHGSATLL